MYSHLLNSEQEAALFVDRIGRDRANELLKKVGDHMNNRAKKFNNERVYYDYAFDAYSVAHQREINLLHMLKMGLTLTTPVETKEMIRERIISRRKVQRETAKQKRRVEQFVLAFIS